MDKIGEMPGTPICKHNVNWNGCAECRVIGAEKFERFVFSKDDIGFYILPLLGFSWGKPYGKNIWFGWFRYCIRINFN